MAREASMTARKHGDGVYRIEWEPLDDESYDAPTMLATYGTPGAPQSDPRPSENAQPVLRARSPLASTSSGPSPASQSDPSSVPQPSSATAPSARHRGAPVPDHLRRTVDYVAPRPAPQQLHPVAPPPPQPPPQAWAPPPSYPGANLPMHPQGGPPPTSGFAQPPAPWPGHAPPVPTPPTARPIERHSSRAWIAVIIVVALGAVTAAGLFFFLFRR
jgi:hypothetical protein